MTHSHEDQGESWQRWLALPDDPQQLLAIASMLDQHPDYRVLRRLVPPLGYGEPIPEPERHIGAILDLETTGVEPYTDLAIEVALVKFEFSWDGRIGRVLGVTHGYEDPHVSLAPEIVELTGITDETVKGQRFPDLDGVLADTDLVIAHHADFDRKIAERRWPTLTHLPWGCSHQDVPWKDFGIGSQKLDYLLAVVARAFHDGHGAIEDCFAVLHVLAQPAAGGGGETYLQHLLLSTRQPIARVWALGSPYETKGVLKARGYRWCDGSHATPKAWYKDLRATDDIKAEREWLRTHVYGDSGRTGAVRRLTARERYSVRAVRL